MVRCLYKEVCSAVEGQSCPWNQRLIPSVSKSQAYSET